MDKLLVSVLLTLITMASCFLGLITVEFAQVMSAGILIFVGYLAVNVEV